MWSGLSVCDGGVCCEEQGKFSRVEDKMLRPKDKFRLVDYVYRELKKGKSRRDVALDLADKGWSSGFINAAMFEATGFVGLKPTQSVKDWTMVGKLSSKMGPKMCLGVGFLALVVLGLTLGFWLVDLGLV